MITTTTLQTQPPPSPPYKPNHHHLIAFTTPQNYSTRLYHLLKINNFTPLPSPTISIHPTPHTLLPYLTPSQLSHFSAIAFTSRTPIITFSHLLTPLTPPPLQSHAPFTLAALGKDADLLTPQFLSKFSTSPHNIDILVPKIATPMALVNSLGPGNGRRILCPVPVVIGLTEPGVVPEFLNELESKGWVVERVGAYETRWAGEKCAHGLLEGDGVDAVVVTSTAEVEGMLKSLRVLGFDWEMVRRKCPKLVVAAHGPVTAAGAEGLGVQVDVVGERFGSFEGVVDALVRRLRGFEVD